MGAKVVFMMIVVVALVEGAAAAAKYKVGGGFGWGIPPNTTFYDEWVKDKKFVAGDSLEFNWTGTHNVLQVTSKGEYDGCTKTNGILKQNSPETFDLSQNGTYYYLCTVGQHCQDGQKVAVVVGNGISPPKNGAALSALLSTTAVVAATLVHLSSFLSY